MFELANQINEMTEERDSMSDEINDLNAQILELESETVIANADLDYANAKIDELDNEVAETIWELQDLNDQYEYLSDAVQGALSDLATLAEVPVNLLEYAVDNIVSDLRKGLEGA